MREKLARMIDRWMETNETEIELADKIIALLAGEDTEPAETIRFAMDADGNLTRINPCIDSNE